LFGLDKSGFYLRSESKQSSHNPSYFCCLCFDRSFVGIVTPSYYWTKCLSYQNPHSHDDTKKVRDHILRRHPTWKIPERRVKKFVKKQQLQQFNQSSDPHPDDDQSVSSVTRRVKGMVRKILVFRKTPPTPTKIGNTNHNHNKPASSPSSSSANSTADYSEAPIQEIHATSLLPASSASDASGTDDELEAPSPERKSTKSVEGDDDDDDDDDEQPAVEVVDEDEAADRQQQEGKALPLDEMMVYKDDNDGKKGGCCAPCEGCIMM
jgi:hypothetical protein